MRTETKDLILKERKQKRMVLLPTTPLDSLKTPTMRLIEAQLGKPVEDILTSGSLSQVARLLGKDPAQISRWRKRLGIVNIGLVDF